MRWVSTRWRAAWWRGACRPRAGCAVSSWRRRLRGKMGSCLQQNTAVKFHQFKGPFRTRFADPYPTFVSNTLRPFAPDADTDHISGRVEQRLAQLLELGIV